MNQHWIRAMNLIRISLPLAAAFVALSGAPEAANAQDRGRGNGRGGVEDVDRRDRERGQDERWEDILRGDREREADRGGNGPPFCRNGQGHPVHGMRWCRDKGWDTGRGGLGDIIFGDRDDGIERERRRR